jgi:hypothetical protein
MGDRRRRARGICILSVLVLLAAGRAAAEETNVKSLAVGLAYDHFSRSVVWSGDEAASKILAHRISVRADIAMESGLVLAFTAGFSLSRFPALTFDGLPVSLQFDGASVGGFALGAEVEAPWRKYGDFEIGAVGWFVYSFGKTETWPLEGFAVEGQAEGLPSWMDIGVGPRVAYLSFDRVRPYLEVTARLLWAEFRMSEALGDLEAAETKKVKGDFALSIALGADARVTDRITVKAKAGFMPSSGGVDGLVSLGALYGF